MKKSELHCNSEARNVQERIDEMSAEKSQQKEEMSEMQHKAQVISKSARMSATDVLSTITSSETIDHEETGQMDEFYERIRSTNTDNDPQDSPENERKSSSSDADLPNIPPFSTTPLNSGVMKSKANVARQGSMKTRRKPTNIKRKSWTPGMDAFNLREQDETLEDAQENDQGDVFVTRPENEEDLRQSGSFTPSDSSSEDEKEAVKQHLRSGIALPGLGDALKIQMTRSELKRPTAVNLVKTAKDTKDNEVTKEDKTEPSPSKPGWMKEMEERKKKPRTPIRKHKTLPARCSELDALFEQRKQTQPAESTTHENAHVASRPKSFGGEEIDPELQKKFEKRKNLKPLELESASYAEGVVLKEAPRPKSFHGGEMNPELSKVFERRKNLPQPVEGRSSSGEDGEPEFKPRNVHLQNSEATELDKVFEKRKQLRPVQAVRPRSPVGNVDQDSSGTVNPRSPPTELRQTSGIVRAKFHDTKLEPLPSRGGVRVATVAEVKSSLHSKSPHPPPPLGQGNTGRDNATAQVAEFVFDGRGASHATVARIPVGRKQRSPIGQKGRTSPEERNSGQETSGAQVAQFVFDGSAAACRATVGRIPVSSAQGPGESPREDHAAVKARINGRGDHVMGPRDDHVRETSSNVTNARDVNTKPQVVSPKSSKADTRGFIEQLSGRAASGKALAQGKSVAKPRTETRGDRRKRDAHTERGFREPYPDTVRLPLDHTDSRPKHDHQKPHPYQGEPRPYPHEGNISRHPSRSTNPPPIREPLPYTLPPLNTYSTHSPSHNQNLRHLPHSLSHPPNSDHPTHLPLHGTTSHPQFSNSPHITHSPRVPEGERVTPPHPVRVREITSAREVELSRGRQMKVQGVPNTGVDSRVHTVARPDDWMGYSGQRTDNEIRRGRVTDGGCNNERALKELPLNTEADGSVRTFNVELANDNRHSDPFITDSDGVLNRGTLHRSQRNEIYDTYVDQSTKQAQNPDGLGYQRIRGIQSPERSGNQRIVENPDRSRDQRIYSVRSREGLDDKGIKRSQSPDRLGDQKISGARNPHALNDRGINRFRSPERSDGKRIKRVRSPDRSGDYKIETFGNPERSHDSRIGGINDLERSGDQMISRIQERKNLNELESKARKEKIDSFCNGLHTQKDLERGNARITSPVKSHSENILNRERCERPQHVTVVTVKSLSENAVYGKSSVAGRVQSRDRDNMARGNIEVVVNGDVGRRGVKTGAFREISDAQSSENTAVPKWKQELRDKKRLQREKSGETPPRLKENIKPEQSGNDMAEWQKRLQGIRKTWGAEEGEGSTGSKDGETKAPGEQVTRPDVDEENNVPEFLKEFQKKNLKQNAKDDQQDTETFV